MNAPGSREGSRAAAWQQLPHRICARCGPRRIRSGHDSGNEGPGPCKKLGEIHCPDCPGKLALAAKQDQARVSHHLESPGAVGKRRAVDSCEPCIWLELRCRRLESELEGGNVA